MRKTFFLCSLVALFGIFGYVSYSFAVEADVDFSADTDVQLTTQGQTVTVVVESGSKANTFEVGASSITVSVGTGGDNFILKDTSASRRMLFTVDGALQGTCSSGQSTLTISNSATTTYVIVPRPDSTCTNSPPSGSGGGGSSGGGGGSPALPAPAPSTPAPSPAPVATPAPEQKTPPPASTPSPVSGAHPNGTLIVDNGTIYLIANGKKRGFRNPAEYFSHGYKFEQAVAANEFDRSLPNDSVPIEKAMDGTLGLDKGTIFMIAGGKKRGFTSAKVFKSLGYQFNQARSMDLADYQEIEPIVDATAPHPGGALVAHKGTVWWILNGTRQGFQSAEVFFTYGFKFSQVVPANPADMALPEGGLVKFRDGTLVKDGEAYFIISQGLKRRFASVNALQNLGYKPGNAISASLTSYTEAESIK